MLPIGHKRPSTQDSLDTAPQVARPASPGPAAPGYQVDLFTLEAPSRPAWTPQGSSPLDAPAPPSRPVPTPLPRPVDPTLDDLETLACALHTCPAGDRDPIQGLLVTRLG
ncbi:MAG TPA: hypothetical protein VFH51_19620, partial [Myxococcota bacterium]|nr:hypothetical protein [Myxococcota bacterium]